MKLRQNILLKKADQVIGRALLRAAGLLRNRRKKPGLRRRILIIKLAALGDTVILLPVLGMIRKTWPHARLDFLCTPVNSGIIPPSSLADNTLIFNPGDLFANPLSIAQLMFRLFNSSYDLVIDFEQWSRIGAIFAAISSLDGFSAGFKRRGQGRHFAQDLSVIHGRPEHELYTFTRLARKCGASGSPDTDVFRRLINVHQNAQETCPGYMAIHPFIGTGAEKRQWPENHWKRFISMANQADMGPFSVICHPSMKGNAQRLLSEAGASGIIWTSSDPAETMAMLSGCRLFAGPNSGPMHLASAAGIPVVALHGPTNHRLWGPIFGKSRVLKPDMPCSPCLSLGFEYMCETGGCMELITPEMVMEACRSIV